MSEATDEQVASSRDIETDDEIGLFDLEDEISEIGDEFTANLAAWGANFRQMNIVNEEVTVRINHLSQFGQPDRNEVRKEVDKVTESLREFSVFGREKIEAVEKNVEDFYRSYSQIILLAKDFESGPEDANKAKSQIEELVQTVIKTEEQMSDFILSLEGLPRLDKNFVRARNSVVLVNKRLRKKLQSFHERLSSLVSSELNAN